MVQEREEQEREQNWAEEEQSTLQALYEREREIRDRNRTGRCGRYGLGGRSGKAF